MIQGGYSQDTVRIQGGYSQNTRRIQSGGVVVVMLLVSVTTGYCWIVYLHYRSCLDMMSFLYIALQVALSTHLHYRAC